MMRLIAGGVLALLGVSLQVAVPQTALACGLGGYHYAIEEVVTTGYGGLYNPPNCPGPINPNWHGTKGLVTNPSHLPFLGNTENHSGGEVAVIFNGFTYLEVGWYAGCVMGSCKTSQIGYFTEYSNIALYPYPLQIFTDYGPAPYNAAGIFRIEYLSGGCWNIFMNYSTLLERDCALPTTGMPYAGSEVLSEDGSEVAMPQTIYGYHDPYTNNGLMVKDVSVGWVPWLTTLSGGSTGYYDERYGQPNCGTQCVYYNISYFNQFYHFLSDGEDPS